MNAAGEVYVVGNFRGTVQLGAFTLTSISSYYSDIFVTKWSAVTNTFVWAQQAGGDYDDRAIAVVVSGSSLYLTGDFSSTTARFGPTTLTNAGVGSTDAYVAKLTDAGATASFTWAQRAGGVGFEQGEGLGVTDNNIYVTGTFDTAATFGATTLPTAGSTDVFIAKLTDAGATARFTWAYQAGSAANDDAYALAVSGSVVYVTGHYNGSAFTFGSVTLPSAGGFDAFVAKLTDRGSTADLGWAQRMGGTTNDFGRAIAASGSTIYVAGTFSGTATTVGSAVLTSAGGDDIFLTKLLDTGPSGSFVWTQQAGGSANDAPLSLAVQGSAVYVAGGFESARATFGSTTLTNAGTSQNDVFITKLLDAGATSRFSWAQQAGGSGNDAALGVAVLGTQVYVSGYVASPASFGALTPAGTTGVQTAFLAQLLDSAPLATPRPLTFASWQLYPNPARGQVLLGAPAQLEATTGSITFYNRLGQVVRTQLVGLPTTGLASTLDLTGLARGSYWVRIQAGTSTTTHHLMLE